MSTLPLTAPFTTLGSFQDLCDYLAQEGVAHSPSPDAQVTEIPTATGLPMALRWEANVPLLQIVQLVEIEIPEARLGEAEHKLALLNHAAPLAGFALDHTRRFIYFRLTLLRDDQDTVAVAALERHMRAVLANVHDYIALLHPAAAEAPAPDLNGVAADPAPAAG